MIPFDNDRLSRISKDCSTEGNLHHIGIIEVNMFLMYERYLWVRRNGVSTFY